MADVRFSAVPKIVDRQRPNPVTLETIAEALRHRGCYVIDVGRFGVAAEGPETVVEQLKKDKGTGDLALVDQIEVGQLPIYFV